MWSLAALLIKKKKVLIGSPALTDEGANEVNVRT